MTTWKHEHPKARKPHRCEFCDRAIQPGETYLRGTGLGDIDFGVTTWAECAHCEAFRLIVDFLAGAFWDEGYCRDSFLEFEPEHPVECLWSDQFRAKWVNHNGDLVAIPTRAALESVIA